MKLQGLSLESPPCSLCIVKNKASITHRMRKLWTFELKLLLFLVDKKNTHKFFDLSSFIGEFIIFFPKYEFVFLFPTHRGVHAHLSDT
jgi:hypothetical protein